MQRRKFIKATTVTIALAAAGFLSASAIAADTIKVGILHSLSGTMAISETALKETALMTIEEINAKGGVLGKKLEPVVVDPASNWPLFAEKARQLSAVALGVATLGLPIWAQAADTIKVGVLHSLSGTMAISETVLKDTVLMA